MSKNKLQKLELTWIGKGDEPKLEPRILIENPEYSYGDSNTENMLIHGDNLLALKALEQDYSGIIKCIYIDPPFNTGAAFDNYDDGVEHSLWMDLMYRRITILYNLLSKDGSIFIHLDDNELDYCKIILDDVFGRSNFINRITIDARSPSAFSTVNPGVFKSSEYILWFAKDKLSWESRSMRVPSNRDAAYSKFIENKDKNTDEWVITSLKKSFLENLNSEKIEILKDFIKSFYNTCADDNSIDILNYLKVNFPFDQLVDLKKLTNYLKTKIKTENNIEDFFDKVYPYLLEKTSYNYKDIDIDKYVFENSGSVYRDTEISDTGAGKETVELKYVSIENPEKIFKQTRTNGLDDIYILNGKQLSFYSKNVHEVDGVLTSTKLLTNIWEDISWEGIANEGGVTFKKGKKPEKLIQRCFELTTNENDYILDSFLGSGTTAAVAHKMNRKYIGIELGEQAYTHCYKRLKSVVSGQDKTGISKNVKWQGGNGFKFYQIAPSLLKQDKFGNWVISEEYNPDMLAAAMAKQEGFDYLPHEDKFWKQGNSSENDFIFTTTQFLTVETLDSIQDDMKEGESVLICCKAFQKECKNKYPNITLKKIPQMLLDRCEFGKDDYSFNIINMPLEVNGDDSTNNVEEISVQAIRDINKSNDN
ncbi:site-specific DNA-methyltransferase [uncultured Flavobacterium sp.]|uniref:site-specific DNA-methyltransferase n=1 Tax=uncultured Flavobacterium sp. TaxID=165435 RepID=UPI0030ECC2FA|tara:strand:- start:66279 stop:68222 length:1944 start_codon:yes stop_codon:yes gene_type:complete